MIPERGSEFMRNLMKKYGGLVLFYCVIVFGVFLLNERFRYLNNNELETKIESEIAFKN